ncbi:YitT family protein [Paenibacillus sp. Sa2BVA9]|uniref:YitT family protein n=2 Tax=Paenibacillus gallinarum TaxID=2762232 RepID=A0ABR8SYA8_9BACL|nr:YitT family protein [Paenibacillus gallinarum]MBD7968069.1 YitT family protein [Paenibacillus gallinarum]
MQMNKITEQLKIIVPILLGTAIFAFGLLYFIIPNQLMEGGVTGITVLLNYAFGISPSISTLIINIPLFLLGWKVFGGRQIIYTGVGIVALTIFLTLFERLIDAGYIVPLQTEHDLLLAALYAGVTIGLGLGIVFRAGGTTGGSDIIARILSKKTGLSIGRVMLAIDIVIIGSSLIYIPLEKILYTLIAVFIGSKVIDFIQEGAYAAKAFTIISDYGPEIADKITIQMERGVTLIPAIGAYSKKAKHVVYSVVSRQEIRELHQIIKSIDPKAFLIINEVHDVHGEGFKEGEK